VKSGKDVSFGVSSKNFHPRPTTSQIPLYTRINLGESDIKIRTAHKNFKLGFKNLPEVEFWPFLRMRCRKLAKNT